jgi:excisionase family DNA binding protein
LSSLSKSTLRRWAKDGRLQTTKFGRRRVVVYASLLELILKG